MESRELNIGRAGEHLVMADLLAKSHQAFMTDQGVNYDIVIYYKERFIRLQVKSTMQPARMNKEYFTPTYLFHVRRCGKGGKRIYNVNEFEGLALVALDTKEIAYIPFKDQIKKTIILRDRRQKYKQNIGKIAPYIDEFPLDKFLENCN